MKGVHLLAVSGVDQMQSLYGILRRVWKRTMRGETDRKRPAEKVGPGDVKENTSDDLTVIRGIGIASQNRLYAAGIKSYPRLAHASAEDVREVLGKFGRGAKIENWIGQAQKLVGEE